MALLSECMFTYDAVTGVRVKLVAESGAVISGCGVCLGSNSGVGNPPDREVTAGMLRRKKVTDVTL